MTNPEERSAMFESVIMGSRRDPVAEDEKSRISEPAGAGIALRREGTR